MQKLYNGFMHIYKNWIIIVLKYPSNYLNRHQIVE